MPLADLKALSAIADAKKIPSGQCPTVMGHFHAVLTDITPECDRQSALPRTVPRCPNWISARPIVMTYIADVEAGKIQATALPPGWLQSILALLEEILSLFGGS